MKEYLPSIVTGFCFGGLTLLCIGIGIAEIVLAFYF
jgi:hypothetical protein